MEAMWTRFLPHIIKVQEMISEGLIGEPRILQASVGFQKQFDPVGRHFNPKLAGGALIDVGIYATTLSYLIFGQPAHIKSFGNLSSAGVDTMNEMLQFCGRLCIWRKRNRTWSKFI